MELGYKTEINDLTKLARKYFSILSITRDLNLTPRELDVLEFLTVEGSLDSVNAKLKWINTYIPISTTGVSCIANIISQLFHKRLIVKVDGKKRINPKISLDLKKYIEDKELKLTIRCLHKEKELKEES